MATDDPFPLFHLAELDFTAQASNLSSLAAHQLPLAQYSTDYSETLEKPLKKAWRQRRERARARMGQPIGVHASEADKQADPVFTRFECIGLDFALTSLQDLTSAQLACVAFHPDANAELVETAEEIFFARRERDFSAGLTLPHPPAIVATPAPALAPAPKPTPTLAAALPPRPETTLPAFVAAAAPATPLSSIAASATVLPLPTPVSLPAKSGAAAWLDDVEMDEPSLPTPAPRKISLEEWRLQQREKEVGPRSVHEDARSSSSRTGRRSERGEKREREPSSRGSESPARRRKTEGAQDWLNDSPRGTRPEDGSARRDTRDWRKDDSRRDIRDEGYGSRERRTSDTGHGRRSDERRSYEGAGRQVDDRHDDLGGARREGWSRLPQEDRSASGLSTSLTRAPPPTDAYNSRAHVPPPPAPPHEKDDLPAELAQTLKIVFIRQIPEKNNVADLHRLLQSFHQVAPIGIKIVRNGVFPSSRTGARVVNAYAAYEFAEDAQTIKHRLDGFKSEGEILQAVDGLPPLNHDGTPKLTGVWKWTFMTPAFRQDYHLRQLDQYHSRQQPPPAANEPRYPAVHQPSRLPLDQPHHDRRIGTDNLPRHISDGLHQLYVSGFPLDVKIDDLRDFVDHLDGLVGIGVSSEKSISKHQRCAAWFAFTKRADCEAACSSLQGQFFDKRASQPLVVEVAKDKQRRNYWFWAEMSKSFRNEYKAPSTQSTPQAPSLPVFQPQPFPPNQGYAAPLPAAPSPLSQARQPCVGGFVQAPPSSLPQQEEPAPSRGFVHPSRLALMDTTPMITPVEDHLGGADDDDDMIIVESSSSTSRRAPPPTLTGANAAASSAAIKSIEDAWASKRRATLQPRGGTETSGGASRPGSVSSAAPSPSPHKTSDSSAAVSPFIEQAVTEGEMLSARKAIVSPAPPSRPLFARLDPPPHATRQNGAQRSPPISNSSPLPHNSPPTGPAAFLGRLPPPTGPRSLIIKGANRSPPLSAIPTGPKAFNAPRGPRADTSNGGMVISVAGGASMRRNSASSSSSQGQDKSEVAKSPFPPTIPLVEATGAVEAEKEGGKDSSEIKLAEVVEVEESPQTVAETDAGKPKDGKDKNVDSTVQNGISPGDAKEEKGVEEGAEGAEVQA